MLPYPRVGNSSRGALETLLLPAVEQQFPVQTTCVDQYCQCILGVGLPWTRTEQDKLRLRCLLSGSNNTDANVGLQYALNPNRNLIPLNHVTFDPITDLLSHFVEWMESQHANWDAWRAAHP
jgi:hypothetical protein